jgi:hypothetical protein
MAVNAFSGREETVSAENTGSLSRSFTKTGQF